MQFPIPQSATGKIILIKNNSKYPLCINAYYSQYVAKYKYGKK